MMPVAGIPPGLSLGCNAFLSDVAASLMIIKNPAMPAVISSIISSVFIFLFSKIYNHIIPFILLNFKEIKMPVIKNPCE